MKKSVLFIAVLMCSLFIFTSMAFAGYQVSGGSVSGSNGLYCEIDEFIDNRPVYQLAGTDWELFYDGGEGGYWYIDDFERGIGVDCTYWVESSASTPPLNGWSDYVGNSPPTLSEQACGNSIPTINEWGMIIMSLMLAGTAFWMIRRRPIS